MQKSPYLADIQALNLGSEPKHEPYDPSKQWLGTPDGSFPKYPDNTLDTELKERSQTHVAWAQITTTPAGAEIIVDGNSTSQFSPSRVQIPAGTHVIALKLNGFQVVRRGVEVSEGNTVIVTENLKAK